MAHTNENIFNYDYVVIGGGTSGAVVARRLAEGDANSSVCLLEAGPSYADVANSRMPGNWVLNKEKSHDWNYDIVAQKGCNNRIINAPRARFLGGCSAINGTVLARGAKADYDRIAAMGNPGWSWEEMLPYFKASETFHPAEWHQSDLTVHGISGPLHTEPYPPAPVSEKVLESFIDCGFEYKPDMFVQGEYEGVGYPVRTASKGIRNEVPQNPVEGEGGIDLYVLLCGPQARGTVRLSSNDSTCKPIIDHAYLENDVDVAVLAEGCRIGHEVLMKGRGTKNIITDPWPKTISHSMDLAAWKNHVRTVATTCFHPCGTCKMAPNTDPMGVVDNRLRVRNVEGLRVADVSILPLINNGHTQAPAYAIAEKVAHMVLQDTTVTC
ncbi:unnamed protein product [Rotaria sp. Silwood2]|nr:unnamed protein product [Rotaria sp. Silwood2]